MFTQQIEEQISYLTGDSSILFQLPEQKVLSPFSRKTCEFLQELSECVRRENAVLAMADVAAFAFWCRKSHLDKMALSYKSMAQNRLGRGVTFHIVPSNVPVLFAFSLSAALLSGNSVVIRLPEKSTLQSELICRCINLVCEKLEFWKRRIVILRYGHQEEITKIISKLCDARIIWGGSHTIQEIRKIPLPPSALELTFGDRKSAAVLGAQAVLETKEMNPFLYDFYNDTYLFDQNACSSPRIIYWIGDKEQVRFARYKFWSSFSSYVEQHYKIDAVTAIKKWEQAYYLSAIYKDMKIIHENNYIIRVESGGLFPEMLEHTVPGGFFIEAQGETIEGLLPVLNRGCQTIAAYGVNREMLKRVLLERKTFGPDRIVEVGQTLAFSLVWDGVDFIYALSRELSLL
ncbi:acyl-CoA reductase [Anaeromicropila populeti]|uniref:long-chain-fatty-acyl-CoA reductase n=1 Tax=Anaeromicropila populeti TaxID=37658 RepID=A0A1I6J0M5_9FIRM|nr:acyl-CoA reductase [Anaeromicropila populeti]SFR72483.1 Acyl-CoA reductase (LuxC) [Anaeromicropila populeti]